MLRRWRFVLLAVSLVGTPAMAADQEATDWLRLRINDVIQRPPYDWNFAQIRSQMAAIFARASADGRTFTRQDLDRSREIGIAQSEAQALSQVLPSDLNHDGRITRDNLRLVIRQQTMSARAGDMERQVEERVRALFADDADGDGVLTLDEVRRGAASRRNAIGNAFNSDRTQIPLALDPAGHDVVTLDDYLAAAKGVFDEIDRDHDGLISQPEAETFGVSVRAISQRHAEAMRLRAETESCGFPSVAPGSRLVAVSASRGARVADLTFGDAEQPVAVPHLVIEAGDTPLTILAWSGTPAIWQVSGATERVSRFLVVGGIMPNVGGQAAGVAGLPRDKVAFPGQPGCLATFGTASNGTADNLRLALGQPPERFVKETALGSVALPSGSIVRDDPPGLIATPQQGPAAGIWQSFRDTAPGGLVRMALDGFVASPAAKPRRTLPGLAGLATLVEDGSLKVISWRTIRRVGMDGPVIIGGGGNVKGDLTIQSVPAVLLATRGLRFPGGVPYGMIQTVVVPEGVPAPENLPPGACLKREGLPSFKDAAGARTCPG